MISWDLAAMTHLAATTQAHPASLASTHAIAIAVLVSVLVGRFAPGWLVLIVGVVAFFAAGVFQSLTHGHGALSGTTIAWLLVCGGTAFLGARHGRVLALRHLGIADFRNRLSTMRGVSRWP